MKSFFTTLLSALLMCLISAPVHAQTIGSGDIRNNAVRSKHIKNKTIQKKDLKPNLKETLLFSSYQLVDNKGTVVGPMAYPGDAIVTLTSDNTMDLSASDLTIGDQVILELLRNGYYPDLYYTGDNCTGEVLVYPDRDPVVPYVFVGPSPGPFPPAGQITGYVPDKSVTPTSEIAESEYYFDDANQPACVDTGGWTRMWALGIPLMDLSAYTPPFRLERVK